MNTRPLLFQTSDPYRYYSMLQSTGRTARRYCERWQWDYQQFVGVKRGYWPWQATFNRVYLLDELVRTGRSGWCVYLDADAYVLDFSFDLGKYLAEQKDCLIMCSPSGASEAPHDVNAGVLALNLDHPLSSDLTREWRRHFDQITDPELAAARNGWPTSMPDDQVMLQWILRDNIHFAEALHHLDPSTFNSPGASFIRQFLRAHDEDLDTRTAYLDEVTSRILSTQECLGEMETNLSGDGPAIMPSHQHYEIVEGLYKVVLRRSADSYGREAFARILIEKGLALGVPEVAGALLGGAEYHSLIRSEGASRD